MDASFAELHLPNAPVSPSPDPAGLARRCLGLSAAAADVITAGQRPNPQLGLGAGNLGRNMGGGSLWNKAFDRQLRVDQVIERGGKPRLRVATAQAQREAARADLAEVTRQASLATLSAYNALAAALARREELTAAAALNRESLQAFEKRVRSGDAARLDATRFELDALHVQSGGRPSLMAECQATGRRRMERRPLRQSGA